MGSTLCTAINRLTSPPPSQRSAGDTITFKPGLSCPAESPITLTSTISISQNLTITGPGASTMMVSGDNAVEVFAVNSGTVTISGLTIENGTAPLAAAASPTMAR